MKLIFKKKNRYIIYLVFSIVAFFIYYNLILPDQIDYSFHVYDVFLLSEDQLPSYYDFYRLNNLFHYLMYFLYSILHIDLRISASIILTIFLMLRVLFFDVIIYRKIEENKKNVLVPLLIISLVFFMSIYNPITKRVYLGNIVGNIWHNPTFLTMILFSLVSVYLFFDYFIDGNKKKSTLLLLSLSMFLCILAKPNFSIVFIPASGLYLLFNLIKNKNKDTVNDILKGLLVCVPTLIYLLILFILSFGKDSSSKIIIDILDVWLLHCKQMKLGIIFAVFCGNMIGLVHYFINKKWKDKKYNYLLLLLFIGLLYYAFLAESGSTFNDGNFAWSYAISGLIFNSYCICDLIVNFVNTRYFYKNIKIMLEISIYSLHVLSGLYYLYRLLGHYIKV